MEYIDTGFSGTKASRPAFDRLMADAAKRRFDAVLVYKLDRFGRSVLNLKERAREARGGHNFGHSAKNGLETPETESGSRSLMGAGHVL